MASKQIFAGGILVAAPRHRHCATTCINAPIPPRNRNTSPQTQSCSQCHLTYSLIQVMVSRNSHLGGRIGAKERDDVRSRAHPRRRKFNLGEKLASFWKRRLRDFPKVARVLRQSGGSGDGRCADARGRPHVRTSSGAGKRDGWACRTAARRQWGSLQTSTEFTDTLCVRLQSVAVQLLQLSSLQAQPSWTSSRVNSLASVLVVRLPHHFAGRGQAQGTGY